MIGRLWYFKGKSNKKVYFSFIDSLFKIYGRLFV